MGISPQTNSTLEEIAQVIREHDNFVLCGHVSPDGDCLGSQLALWHALRALEKNAACVLVNDEAVDGNLLFMPGAELMEPAGGYSGACDVFIGLDVPVRSRIGAASALLDASSTSITIDHHAADERMCELAYIDPDSASASILVWKLVKLLLDEPPIESALCAYVGLVTDTGGFRFQNSDAKAFEAASELVSIGVDPARVAVAVFQNRSRTSLELEAIAIGRMRLLAGGEGVLSWVERADFERIGATKLDAEPLIDCIRSLAGIRIACMLREQDDGIRGNLRSKGDIDVSALARELGGGGHKAAAGVRLQMPIGQAVEYMSEKISETLSAAGR